MLSPLGVDPQALLDEMLGRASGINGGRAGSMNVPRPSDRLIGSFGIVGGSIAAATGAALALKRTTGGVAVAYFGDGAMNQGYFFECLNFCQVLEAAARPRLREQRLRRVHAVRVGDRGRDPRPRRGHGGAGRDDRRDERLDGARGRARARSRMRAPGDGPAFVEAITYRFVGHSRSDPGAYRPEGELDRWRERDPIVGPARAARGGRRRRRRRSTSSSET